MKMRKFLTTRSIFARIPTSARAWPACITSGTSATISRVKGSNRWAIIRNVCIVYHTTTIEIVLGSNNMAWSQRVLDTSGLTSFITFTCSYPKENFSSTVSVLSGGTRRLDLFKLKQNKSLIQNSLPGKSLAMHYVQYIHGSSCRLQEWYKILLEWQLRMLEYKTSESMYN